jgi:peptidoglycan/LPS O-acetylase OafA/YrhL
MEAELQLKANITGYSLRLEALRGLAALLVVGHHAYLAPVYPWARIFFNGSGAVSLFFVLSGYVLGLSLWRGTGPISRQYTFFMCRRVFRIYPAYFVTTLAFLFYWKVYPFSEVASQLGAYAKLRLTPWGQIKSFLFLDYWLNPVTWSLKVEMIGSMMLPILHFLSRKWHWSLRFVVLLLLLLLAFLPIGFATTQRRLFMFYLGYLVIDLERLPKFACRSYKIIAGLCLGAFFAAAFLRDGFPGFQPRLFLEAISAAGLIFCIQAGSSSLGGTLDHSWSRFAGRVSYSVFLIHVLILDVVVNLMMLSPLRTASEHGLGLLVSLPLVMLVASILYRWVEKPFMDMSKVLFSNRSNRKVAAT